MGRPQKSERIRLLMLTCLIHGVSAGGAAEGIFSVSDSVTGEVFAASSRTRAGLLNRLPGNRGAVARVSLNGTQIV